MQTSTMNKTELETEPTATSKTKLSTIKSSENISLQHHFPRVVWIIIIIEFCERFSFYGMRAILTRYLIFLGYKDHAASAAFHAFVVVCYFTTLPGAIISDSWLGRYRTILYISVVYAAGQTMLALASFNQTEATSIIALLLIGIGTGGIKPCVSAFGGDQFVGRNESSMQQFFALFYLSINIGALVSIIVMPVLRNISCIGWPTCYPIAFGIPALAMWLAVGLFYYFRKNYVILEVKENVIVKAVVAIWHALRRPENPSEHWIYAADDQFDRSFLNDVRKVLNVLMLFIPLPLFWALFDQQSSTWFIQSLKLDNRLFGYQIIEEQMTLINPLAVVIFVPVLTYFMYPRLANYKHFQLPHHRILLGGCTAAVSFLFAAVLEYAIQNTPLLRPNQVSAAIINATPCKLILPNGATTEPYASAMLYFPLLSQINFQVYQNDCPDSVASEMTPSTITFRPTEEALNFLLIQKHVSKLKFESRPISLTSTPTTSTIIPILVQETIPPKKMNLTLKTKGDNYFSKFKSNDDTTIYTGDYLNIPTNTYNAELQEYNATGINCGKFLTKIGRLYLLLVDPQKRCRFETLLWPRVNIAWQSIQIVILSVGEVMYSVTGLEMSYQEAPASMKSIVQAGWTLTVAFGNAIVIFVEIVKVTENEVLLYIMYGLVMLLDMGAFYALCRNYHYSHPRHSTLQQLTTQQSSTGFPTTFFTSDS